MHGTNTMASSGHHGAAPELHSFLIRAFSCASPSAAPDVVWLNREQLTEVRIGRGSARDHALDATHKRLRIDCADRFLSGHHTSITWAKTHWKLADAGSKNGTRVNGAKVEQAPLRDGDWISIGGTTFVYRDCQLTDAGASAVRSPEAGPLATASPALQLRLDELRKIAGADVPIVLTGETGTGKELVASALHAASGRAGSFVAVNCGAIAETLLEAELFGHVAGAFSGATEARQGLVRAADGGTLFLDEVAELTPAAQVKLLRVLQEREVRPVGSEKVHAVDLRIIAASHDSLPVLVNAGKFRADLHARLAGFTAALPPLRERKEDLGLICAALLHKLDAARIRFAPDAMRRLFRYDWPHNIRELDQALRVAIATTDDGELRARHLPLDPDEPGPPTDDPKAQLEALLRKHAGNISAVARAMVTSRGHVRRLAARYGIEVERFREQ